MPPAEPSTQSSHIRRGAGAGRPHRSRRHRAPREAGSGPMSTYEQLSEIPLEIESYDLEPLERDVSSDFTRLSTVIRVKGGGHEALAIVSPAIRKVLVGGSQFHSQPRRPSRSRRCLSSRR